MKRMLIDAAHPEETRVVILDGNRIDDLEVETQGKQQLKGNIYIGHVSRVEPSLQAAFITYGGNRNGFLAFGEVHPQFFAVKDAERKKLLEEVAEQAARRRGMDHDEEPEAAEAMAEEERAPAAGSEAPAAPMTEEEKADAEAAAKAAAMADAADATEEGNTTEKPARGRGRRGPKRVESRGRPKRAEATAEAPAAESKEGKAERKSQPAIHRRYRIQDVLKEGQKILVQVVKEERGSKGAALTTYFSLPGRYTVLMPNTPYAGGISRKITDAEERRQLRRAYAELKVPDTMGLIIRTAGTGQDIKAIKHDYKNLTNLWQSIIEQFEQEDDIQCIHEDGSIIIRALRDMMSDDIEDITIAGPRAYKMAKDFAKNLMPDAVGLINQHKEDTPLFTFNRVEQKLNQLHFSRVTLPSGGYLIINPTEALVAVDINSGRATQERNIEETALKTNLEACEELARQIRLRDLAGLIVVDFIDMEENRNVRKVESAMRKALRRDRARIQTGNISDFGLMEISRQRLRPAFSESHFVACPHCQGSGWVHSPASSALMVLRQLEDENVRDADRVIVTSSSDMILWLLNHKRDLIRQLEERYKYQLQFRADDTFVAPDHRIELINIKADGTETATSHEVLLREQPELPPELRQRGNHRERDRDRERGESRRDRERDNGRDKADKEGKAPRRGGRDAKDKDKDARPAREAHEPRAEKQDGNRDESGRRPRRIGAEPAAAADESGSKPAKAGAKPAVEKEKPAKPKPKAKDEPLAVQKVDVEVGSTPAVAAAPRKKMAVKKQADTDAADAPIAIAKISAEGGAESAKPASKPRGKAAEKKQSGSIISRIIGR